MLQHNVSEGAIYLCKPAKWVQNPSTSEIGFVGEYFMSEDRLPKST